MNITNKPTKIFEFKENIVQLIIDELNKAEKFIKIAIFQIHNKEIFKILENKLNKSLKVDIFTLPYDSINDDIRKNVITLFENLKNKGATIHFCKWNIGDPERTTTAIGRWYLFHGKFIITDKSAIVLSANLMQEEELDAAIIFRDDTNKIDEYNKKLDYYGLFLKNQVKGAYEFSEFYENLLPKKNHPDMDWDEAMKAIVYKSNDYLDFISKFLSTYRIYFNNDIVGLLEDCKNKASFCRDTLMRANEFGEINYRDSYKSGEDFYNSIEKAYKSIKDFIDKEVKI